MSWHVFSGDFTPHFPSFCACSWGRLGLHRSTEEGKTRASPEPPELSPASSPCPSGRSGWSGGDLPNSGETSRLGLVPRASLVTRPASFLPRLSFSFHPRSSAKSASPRHADAQECACLRSRLHRSWSVPAPRRIPPGGFPPLSALISPAHEDVHGHCHASAGSQFAEPGKWPMTCPLNQHSLPVALIPFISSSFQSRADGVGHRDEPEASPSTPWIPTLCSVPSFSLVKPVVPPACRAC